MHISGDLPRRHQRAMVYGVPIYGHNTRRVAMHVVFLLHDNLKIMRKVDKWKKVLIIRTQTLQKLLPIATVFNAEKIDN